MPAKFFFPVTLVVLASGVLLAETREMSTDRPDTTESAYSVPAGNFQVEMSFFDYSRDRSAGSKNETWSFGLMNLKAGLNDQMDLQLIFDSWTRERSDGQTSSGFSDVTLRWKTNLWGNDGGKTALAVMPYLTIPTDSKISGSEWEGGLIVPLAINLNDRVFLGLMIEADYVADDFGGHRLEWLHSATLGVGLTEKLGSYVELVGIAGPDTDYQALFDAGLTLAVTDHLIFDTGVRLGLNDAAEDLAVFTGMSVRF
jgi:hypothetical protein